MDAILKMSVPNRKVIFNQAPGGRTSSRSLYRIQDQSKDPYKYWLAARRHYTTHEVDQIGLQQKVDANSRPDLMTNANHHKKI